VRWYLRCSLSLREVEELLVERGMAADHTTIWLPLSRDRLHRCVINTDKARPYCAAIAGVKEEGTLRRRCRHRPVQYLNNILEQDHRAIKRRVKAKQSFREFRTARRPIAGYEAIHMIRKGQARWVSHDVCQQNQFADQLFELPA
jgi:transposase-like protein